MRPEIEKGKNVYRIFIVEDDQTIAALMAEALGRWGFDAVCAQDFSEVLAEFRACAPHLVVLDISLPFYNGYYWCEKIRRESKVPVVFVSSHTDNMDQVMAMNMGADDFIVKPFSTEVLIAKISALLRRVYSYTQQQPALEACGALLENDGTLRFAEKTIELSKNEHRILKTLFERKNSVVSRQTIMQALWNSDSFIDDNTLTVNINRLRRKLEQAGLTDLIQTKKGEGYMVHD